MNLPIQKALILSEVYEKIRVQKLPIKLAYKLTKIFSEIEKETDFYYRKLREIIDIYAERDDEGKVIPADSGGGVKIKQDSIAVCQSEIDELTTLEVILPDITFSLEELESLELTVDEFSLFLPFIEE